MLEFLLSKFIGVGENVIFRMNETQFGVSIGQLRVFAYLWFL